MISHAKPADRPDVTQFATVIDELVARCRDLVSSVESLTVVYDAGQNSGDNHTVVEEQSIGFVGSLPPSDHAELLAIGDRAYRGRPRPLPRAALRRHHPSKKPCCSTTTAPRDAHACNACSPT